MKMSINKKLKYSFSFIFILLLLTAIFSILSLEKSITSLENIILKNQQLQLKLLHINSMILEEINSIKDILAFGDNKPLYEKKLKNYNNLKQNLNDTINLISKTYIPILKNKELITELKNLNEEKRKIDSILDKTLSIYKIKGKKEAFSYLKNQTLLRKYRKISLIASKNRKNYEVIFASAIAKKQNTILTIAVVFIIVILLAIFITNSIAKNFTENIKYLIISAENVSLGQLDSPIEAKSGDELEDIFKIFEYLRIEIKKNIEKIRESKE